MEIKQFTPNRHLVLALRIVIGAQILTLLLGLALMGVIPSLVLVLTILVILASLLLALAFYVLYHLHPLTKAKLALQKQLGQIDASMLATDGNLKAAQRLRDSTLFDQDQEIKRTIASLQNAYFALQLKQQPIDQAKIPGIGPKLKERLAAHRILTAYDVSPDIANLEGFGASKSQALLDWRASVTTALEPGKPRNLPPEKRAAINQSYQGRIAKAEAEISASTNQLTQLESQSSNLETSLAGQQEITLSQYLQSNLTAVTAGRLSPKIASVLTAALLAITTLFQCGQGARSTMAVIASSIPTNTAHLHPDFHADTDQHHHAYLHFNLDFDPDYYPHSYYYPHAHHHKDPHYNAHPHHHPHQYPHLHAHTHAHPYPNHYPNLRSLPHQHPNL